MYQTYILQLKAISTLSSTMPSVKGTFHLTISTRGQRATGKIQRNNYHHGSCGPSLTGKTMSVFLIFTQWTHRNVKNHWVRSSLKAWSPYSRKDRKHVLATMSQRAYFSSLGVDCKNLLWGIAIIKNIHYHVNKLRLNHSCYRHWEPGPWIVVQDLQHCPKCICYPHSSFRKQLL